MADIQRIDPNHRRSRVVVHDSTIYLGGQVGDDLRAEITKQTQQALARVDRLLADLGSSKSKLLTVTIWLKTMDDYPKMNEVWDAWIDPANPPGRSCGVVEMADPGLRFELTGIAAR